MRQFYKICILFHLIFFLISCVQENSIVYFSVFIEAECGESVTNYCVVQEEFEKIKAIRENNDDKCLPITITDIDGNIREGILRGYSSTDSDLPCN